MNLIYQFLIGSMRNFVYLIVLEKQNAYIVDPQSDTSEWEEVLTSQNLNLAGVILTHTHHDHVGGVPVILEKYPNTKIFVHKKEFFRLEKNNFDSSRFEFIEDGSLLAEGKIKVIHTPGHTIGECCYWIDSSEHSLCDRSGKKINHSGPFLLSGDTVFIGDVGRTDLPTGNNKEMFESLQKLKKLPPQTLLLPGHDYGREPVNFLQMEMKYSPAWLCKTVEELATLP